MSDVRYPVYHFNVNVEAAYVVLMAHVFAAGVYEFYDNWTGGDKVRAVIFLPLCIIGIFYFAIHLPFMLRTELLRIVSGGIEFRELGFIPWQSIGKIGVNDDGVVFQFSTPEMIKMTNNYFRRVERRGDQILMVLRTSKISLDASTFTIGYELMLQYAAYLEPALGFNHDTSPDKISARILQEKRGIKFFEKYEDTLAAFNSQDIVSAAE